MYYYIFLKLQTKNVQTIQESLDDTSARPQVTTDVTPPDDGIQSKTTGSENQDTEPAIADVIQPDNVIHSKASGLEDQKDLQDTGPVNESAYKTYKIVSVLNISLERYNL